MPRYDPAWNSLRRRRTPEWLRDAKFGIYTHWGVYSVPACGPNATWYPYNMYREGNAQYEHHLRTYGGPQAFGYKEFIPDFTGTRFDPDEWAELFRNAGARFAGPVAEHHDGFSMWDSQLNGWNAARMGPKRDVVGALERACRSQGMKYLVAMHHAENWWFYPHWRKEYDTADPRFSGLYGEPHNVDGPLSGDSMYSTQDLPSLAFLNLWRDKVTEVIDRYTPDLIWFDFGLNGIAESYVLELLAYYYNRVDDGLVTYKWNHLPPNIALLDHELGREGELTYHEWFTDTTVDDGEGWGYVKDAVYKTSTTLIHYLIDNVSKNGYLLLNVGPKPDGTIPEQAQAILKDMGRWLEVNGEAIYGTTPWYTCGEGPTKLEMSGAFSEGKTPHYTAEDIRFTVKGDSLYAICLGLPDKPVTLFALQGFRCYPGSVRSVVMLGSMEPIIWKHTTQGLVIQPPQERPCEHACVFRIDRGSPYGVD